MPTSKVVSRGGGTVPCPPTSAEIFFEPNKLIENTELHKFSITRLEELSEIF